MGIYVVQRLRATSTMLNGRADCFFPRCPVGS